MSVAEAAARVRGSSQGRIVALCFGYRTAAEFADWLEATADDALTQRVAPAVVRYVEKYEARATPSARARELGREIVAAIRRYQQMGRSV